MNKLKMCSMDIASKNIEKIKDLFPNCISEGKIDFNMLKQELSKDIIEDGKERYQLTWNGKKEAIVNANMPCNKTLRPQKEKSINFENTKNIYIEGDNLEVLKLLHESYLNKIKCIYIDHPYNTGNDFIYRDKFINNDELKESGQIDEYNNRLITNNDSNGKFHSDWLSMMYQRIKIARDLLKEDGVLAISIDDNELYNLKKICDEIFGEESFINNIAIKMSTASGVKLSHRDKKILKTKEYLLLYCKNKDKVVINPQYTQKEQWDPYYEWFLEKNGDNVDDWKVYKLKDYIKDKIGIDEFDLGNAKFKKFYFENADKIWQRGRNTSIPNDILKLSKDNWEKIFEYNGENGEKQYCYKGRRMAFLSNVMQECISKDGKIVNDMGTLICDFWNNISTAALFSEGGVNFPNGKKPQLLLNILLRLFVNNDDYIMDFFSGSASTAEAVLRLNAYDNKKNKFILVQIPEKISTEEFDTICDLGEERIRRSGNKIKEETNADIDYGFRVYKVDSSNMKDVYYVPTDLKQSQLNMFESNIKEDRTAEDLLTQVILDLGLTLDLSIEEKKIFNNNVYFVENNSLVACFDDTIDINIVDEICKCNPLKIVFKENSFKTDSDKINIFERIKKISNDTEINII